MCWGEVGPWRIDSAAQRWDFLGTDEKKRQEGERVAVKEGVQG